MHHIGRIHLNKKQKKEVKRIVEYLVSGGAFFWSGYLTFFIIDQGLGWSLWWATSISYIVGWTVNYLLQRYWVFNNPKLAKHQTEVTGRYIVISLVNLVINYLILEGLNSIGITPYIGQFISSAFFTVWNYIWYKYWVFPQKFPSKRSSPAKPAARRSRPRRVTSRAAAVSKTPVLTQRILYTPHSVPHFFLASTSSEKHLSKAKDDINA